MRKPLLAFALLALSSGVARAGPAQHTTTSPPCFSFSRSASSSA